MKREDIDWANSLLFDRCDDCCCLGTKRHSLQVWICDICHKRIHVRKQISIRCNIIEHWVHLRCAGIRQEQYTDTWTCHLHKESGLTYHTDITPPHPTRPWSKPLPTSHQLHPHQGNPNTYYPPTPLIPRTRLIYRTSAALDTIPEPRVPPTCPALTLS